MSSSYWRSQIKQLERKLQALRPRQATAFKKAADLERAVSKLEKQAQGTSSESMHRNYLRRMESKQRELSRARDAEVKLNGEIGTAEGKLSDARVKLAEAEDREKKAADAKAERDRRQRERQAQARERAEDRRRKRTEQEQHSREIEQDRRITDLTHRATELELQLAAAERRNAPPEISVLFLAASPENQTPLRLDKETREIQKRLRSTEYRDAVWIDWRPARQLPDLIQDLNEVEPHVVHFSGHSDGDALVFEDSDGNATELTNDQLGRLLRVGGGRIRLAVFNSCDSKAQAQLAIQHIDLAIGMETSIGDVTAKTFAAQFYNSIGFGKSVAEAFRQAVLAVELEHGRDQEAPRLFAAEGVDPETVVLVNPGDDA
jgi:hypothetical protein